MIYSQNYAPGGLLDENAVYQTLSLGLTGKFKGQKVLALIPDHTRSLPLPALFRMVVDLLHDARQLDFMIALGTHPAMTEQHIQQIVGISADERSEKYRHIGLLNHAWNDPAMLTSLGTMDQAEIRQIAGDSWHPSLPNEVAIRINKLVLEYDHILIIGPTFPHEVVGFSGGAKYLFPGISGPDMINATHWLGALAGVVGTIGIKETPVRAMIHVAAARLKTPVTLIALTIGSSDNGNNNHSLSGIFIGDLFESWSAASDLSARCHIQWCERAFQRVLSCAPTMYNELWTAAKA